MIALYFKTSFSLHKLVFLHLLKDKKRAHAVEFLCSTCKDSISAIVYEYSIEHFGKALCTKHQELEKQKLSCQNCRQLITKTVYDYSIGRYTRPLCIRCQGILGEIPKKGDDTFDGKGFYCSQCKKTISFPMYRFTMRNYHTPLCKNCQEQQ